MELFKDQSYSFEERAMDIISRMTPEEKANQLDNVAAAIPRLGIPKYNYWGEASHGIIIGPRLDEKADVTSFPTCLAMSQSWNPDLVLKVGKAITDEGRAFFNKQKGNKEGNTLYWFCPTIDNGRDPRWGRNDECFGEDPILTAKLASSYIKGFQGDNKYLKSICSAKHYALNNSEYNRMTGTSNAEEATLREYYLKVWELTVKGAPLYSLMSSYNRVNGIPVPANKFLLHDILREEWGFNGFVVSDCPAVKITYAMPVIGPLDLPYVGHTYFKDIYQATANCLIAGNDMACGDENSQHLTETIKKGYITEDIIDRNLYNIMLSRFRLGLFDDPEKIPYYQIDESSICSKENQQLAVDSARESIVLVKNNGILPINTKKYRKILVVGPSAIYQQLGSYSPNIMSSILGVVINDTPLNGIMAAAKEFDIDVEYSKGWGIKKSKMEEALELVAQTGKESGFIMPGAEDLTSRGKNPPRFPVKDDDLNSSDNELMEKAISAARKVDLVIVIAGNDPSETGEMTDRPSLMLPYGQNEKICALFEANQNLVVCGITSGCYTGEFIDKVPALIHAVYAGQSQGVAIADVLFGKYNPSAKLTQTWYESDNDLPHISQYGIRPNDTTTEKGRTYQFFTGKVKYPFGYGLSYTSYEYSNFHINNCSFDANDVIKVSVDVTNTGKYYGGEIVQLYVRKKAPEGKYDNKPLKQLKAFGKVWLNPGETKTLILEIDIHDISFWSNFDKHFIIEPGIYTIMIGRDAESVVFEKQIEISGEWNVMVCSVTLTPEKYVLSVGETAKTNVVAVRDDASKICDWGKKAVFVSSSPSVAKISEHGVIEAIAPGVTTISATVSENGCSKTGSIPVVVK